MEKKNWDLGKKGQKGRPSKYAASFKQLVSRDYHQGQESLRQVALRFGVGRSDVYKWSKEFSFELAAPIITPFMTEQEEQEMQAVQRQMEALKKQLEFEQMKNFALEAMIDLAKEELNIDLRKNFGAKQPEE